MDYIPEEQSKSGVFTIGFAISQVLGILSIALVSAWTGSYLGGFAWKADSAKQFNYHPLFMTVGMIFLYGDAILVYRVLRNERKSKLKIIHALLHIFAFIFTVVALKAAFDSHDFHDPPIPNLYSLHSWIGLATVILFCLQYVFGFVSYLFPGVPVNLRAKFMPLHIFFGLTIFVMAVVAAISGITEKAFFHMDHGKYSEFPKEAVLVNCFGFVLVLTAITVVYLVASPQYKRKPLPEELSTSFEGDLNLYLKQQHFL